VKGRKETLSVSVADYRSADMIHLDVAEETNMGNINLLFWEGAAFTFIEGHIF
jgi:hypothetical protein